MQTTTTTIKNRIFVGLIAAAIFFGIGLSAPQAHAQTDSSKTADLLAQIESLMELISKLQTQLAAQQPSTTASPEGGFSDRSVMIGNRVQTSDILRVRAGASTEANLINSIAAYTGGMVKDGPRYADGYTWWHVTYDNGTTGWSAENWLITVKLNAEQQAIEAQKLSEDKDEDKTRIMKEEDDQNEQHQDVIDDLQKSVDSVRQTEIDSLIMGGVVTINTISDSVNPVITGSVLRYNEVTIAIFDGGEIYRSNGIKVDSENQWRHQVKIDLDDGDYLLKVLVDDQVKAQKEFTIQEQSQSEINDLMQQLKA